MPKAFICHHLNNNMIQLVIPYNQHASTTSRLIANKFQKRHSDVLRAIKELDCSKEFTERNFALSEYVDGTGRKLPEYIITRDGFVFLVMGFTGDPAAKFKEEYLEEFNRMENALRFKAAPTSLAVYTQRILSEPTKGVPKDYWSVFDKAHAILLLIEAKIGCYNKYDLADGSIGRKWSEYRKGKPWAVACETYTHGYEDERGPQPGCKCYHRSELQYFDEWLMEIYKYDHLYDYLYNKYKKEKNITMLDRIQSVLIKLLKRSA
jgi:Rha family phage regulatory protein